MYFAGAASNFTLQPSQQNILSRLCIQQYVWGCSYQRYTTNRVNIKAGLALVSLEGSSL
jgi:hypothetical protein